jgi:hypothetical protein
MFDSRSERFRRDSVKCFLMGLIFLVARWSRSGAFGNSYGDFYWILPPFLFSAWSYLAYRRSLAPDFDWGTSSEETKSAEPFDKRELVTLEIGDSHTESNARTTNKKSPQSS